MSLPPRRTTPDVKNTLHRLAPDVMFTLHSGGSSMWTVRRVWAVFISLAVLACLANLFGPAERWWGVDLGATGAAVFHLALSVAHPGRPATARGLSGGLVTRRASGLAGLAFMPHPAGIRQISSGCCRPRRGADHALRRFRRGISCECIVVLFIAWRVTARYWVAVQGRSNSMNATCGCAFRPIARAIGR